MSLFCEELRFYRDQQFHTQRKRLSTLHKIPTWFESELNDDINLPDENLQIERKPTMTAHKDVFMNPDGRWRSNSQKKMRRPEENMKMQFYDSGTAHRDLLSLAPDISDTANITSMGYAGEMRPGLGLSAPLSVSLGILNETEMGRISRVGFNINSQELHARASQTWDTGEGELANFAVTPEFYDGERLAE